MPEPEKPEKRVVMAREVAQRWLGRLARAEYRMRILYGVKEIKNLPNLLRSFRDRKAHFIGVPVIEDLGVKEGFDYVDVWSGDRSGLIKLRDWFEDRGYETTGIW